ncbi:Pentatricopeptide repeat-containing protein At2g20540 [Euphorbia peplus]|nr:Pentatricopeptide repeat-containing protein At2g20540 [Euphorbia peplus]
MAKGIGALPIRELENIVAPMLQNCKNISELMKIHGLIVKFSLSQSNFLVTKMVNVCDVSKNMNYAAQIFKKVAEPNAFLYNAMVRGYTHNSMYAFTIDIYKQMLTEAAIFPNEFTFPFAVKSCGRLLLCNLGKQIHAQFFKFGPESHLITENALIDMYTRWGNLVDACNMFDKMIERDVISWNGVICGYAKVGQMRKARALFDEMPSKTVVTWTAMISGNTRSGCYGDALEMFRGMQYVGIEPDEASIVSVLPACSKLGALEVGKWIHFYCEKKGLLMKTCICNCLIEMYMKCGCVDDACRVFEQMCGRDVISWSTMIVGLASHGKALEAIKMFERMKLGKIKPNGITFVGLLSACAHAGLWKEGLMYFDTMRENFHIEPEIEHYGSLVDLLGRAGRLNQALDIVEKMPKKPDSKIWGSILSCCRTYNNIEIAVIAIEHLEELEPGDAGNYVLLSNIYADLGKWEDVSRMRKLIRSKRMKRKPGGSSIEVNNVVQEFVSGDVSKTFSKHIFWLLQLIASHEDLAEDIIQIMPEDGCE